AGCAPQTLAFKIRQSIAAQRHGPRAWRPDDKLESTIRLRPECKSPSLLSMTPARFDELMRRFATLRTGVIGDFSLDRYFDIDPSRSEISIETILPVHNVTQVRCHPGAAGNIVNNIAALGAAAMYPVGYCGDVGEGFELRRALERVPNLSLEHF